MADAACEPLRTPVSAGVAVLAGAPTAAVTELVELAGAEIGVWEMTEGVVTDVEADEVFVVVSGRGTVELADGRVIELAAGAVVHLAAGERTTWTVHESLRKVYVTPHG